MLSASIHGKHERAKRGKKKKTTEKGGEGNSTANVCHKNTERNEGEELEASRKNSSGRALYSIDVHFVCTIDACTWLSGHETHIMLILTLSLSQNNENNRCRLMTSGIMGDVAVSVEQTPVT